MVGRETTFPFGSRPIFRDKLLVSGTIGRGFNNEIYTAGKLTFLEHGAQN